MSLFVIFFEPFVIKILRKRLQIFFVIFCNFFDLPCKDFLGKKITNQSCNFLPQLTYEFVIFWPFSPKFSKFSASLEIHSVWSCNTMKLRSALNYCHILPFYFLISILSFWMLKIWSMSFLNFFRKLLDNFSENGKIFVNKNAIKLEN